MRFNYFLSAALFLLPTYAISSDNNLSDSQKKQIEQIVHDYLVNHPEVLVEVSQSLQAKQQQQMQEQAQSAIQENHAQLFNDKMTISGNPKGNVTLVEFFDYQCIHCKKMAPILSELIKKNKNLRVIYKEFPIFGENSDIASKVALSASLQGKYLPLHEALLNQEQRLSKDSILNSAKSLGLDVQKIKTDMNNTQITSALDENRQLAEKLRLMGTPAIIIASTPNGVYQSSGNTTFIPGAATEETLQELINKAAGQKS